MSAAGGFQTLRAEYDEDVPALQHALYGTPAVDRGRDHDRERGTGRVQPAEQYPFAAETYRQQSGGVYWPPRSPGLPVASPRCGLNHEGKHVRAEPPLTRVEAGACK
jgi:hypothetical protein